MRAAARQTFAIRSKAPAAPLQLDHMETNQKVHNEHRAPRAMPQGTESAQMRTQKLRLTFSTDTHIHND
jgi:hypothetical protein